MARRFGWPLAALVLLAVVYLNTARRPAVRVPVSDSSVLTADLTPADLDVPLPPGAAPVGRVTRQESSAGSSTQALLDVPPPPPRVIAFYNQRWPGARNDRGGPAGPAVFVRQAAGHYDTIRVEGQGTRSRVLVVCRRPGTAINR